ncbi:MAG TPA: ligase-associated DNA damage response endonuclease PdeM [Caulobacteraceae bacterium]|nr:ligase-associated DNA damage response endonuclease PdeM [Caulobacteraceae bacterium]
MGKAFRAPRLAPAQTPCGSLWLEVAGAEACLRRSGALWLEAGATLAAGDLHLEKGSAYAARGQLLPPYDTVATLERLEAEVEALRPRVVVLLGDSFHDAGGPGRLGASDAARISALARGRTLIWIVGNHDREGLGGLPGERAEAATLCGLVLRHEPRTGVSPGEVAGHLHPCAKVVGNGGSVRRRCFVTDGERLILPAFGAYAGGLNVRDVAFAGLFARAPIAAALGNRRVHPIAYARLTGD